MEWTVVSVISTGVRVTLSVTDTISSLFITTKFLAETSLNVERFCSGSRNRNIYTNPSRKRRVINLTSQTIPVPERLKWESLITTANNELFNSNKSFAKNVHFWQATLVERTTLIFSINSNIWSTAEVNKTLQTQVIFSIFLFHRITTHLQSCTISFD